MNPAILNRNILEFALEIWVILTIPPKAYYGRPVEPTIQTFTSI